MAKDTVGLLKRFIADEDAALREGRCGTVWNKEKGRIGPLVKRAWKELPCADCASLYAHLMRRTGKIPNVADVDYLDEARALPRLRRDPGHEAELRACVEAAHSAVPSADLAARIEDWSTGR